MIKFTLPFPDQLGFIAKQLNTNDDGVLKWPQPEKATKKSHQSAV
jgi:hypothetical protein